MNLSRRQFLIKTGAAAGGIAVLSGCGVIPVLPTFAGPEGNDAYTWVQLTPAGDISFLCPRSEMGQGIVTSLGQVVAEELGLALEAVSCVYPDTSQIPPAKMTVGSESVEGFATPLALAAASLRERLRQLAAVQLDVPAGSLELSNGAFIDGARSVSFTELANTVADTSLSEVLDAAAITPPPELYSLRENTRLVGKPQALVHAERIVTGAEIYSRDARVDGMLFGQVARSPWLGAKPLSWDAGAAGRVPGVVAVVDGPDAEIGVIGETPSAARKGIDALAIKWEPLSEEKRLEIDEVNDIDRGIRDNLLDHTPVDEGDITRGQGDAAHSISVRYDTPMAAHASMEPRAGLAYFEGKRCVVHTGSQDPWYVRGAVARAIGYPLDDVVVQNHRMGGGFGGRIHCQASVEAAWLSKGVVKPVKVQWSREEEFTRNYAGPGFSHRIEAGVDDNGEICSWHHQMLGSPILTTSALIPPHLHWAANLVPDPGTWRGAETSYRIGNQLVKFGDARRPMPTGAWRGLGAAPNTFAVECAMDELALAAGVDPIEFRIRHAGNPRLAGVLERLRDMLPVAADDEIGVAANAYKGVTFVAVAASVDANGNLKRFWCVHDCGRIVNPDRVRAQIEGCLVWGVGMAKHEAFIVKDGLGRTDNFSTYKVPRIDDVPAMEIALVESAETSSGAGEAAFPPATAAIVNALARLGERQRMLPVT